MTIQTYFALVTMDKYVCTITITSAFYFKTLSVSERSYFRYPEPCSGDTQRSFC